MWAQNRNVGSRNAYERVLVIAPLIGKGTVADPKRPMYAPLATEMSDPKRTGIIGYTYQVSDDGKTALVEFVARDRSAFKGILGDITVKAFIKGKDKPKDIEAEFKKYKKTFSFDNFGVRVP